MSDIETSKVTTRSTTKTKPLVIINRTRRRNGSRNAPKATSTSKEPAEQEQKKKEEKAVDSALSHSPEQYLELLNEINGKLSALSLGAGSGIKSTSLDLDSKTAALSSSVDSTTSTVIPRISLYKEKDVCAALFSPFEKVPEYSQLRIELLRPMEALIPIHQFVYDMLRDSNIDKNLLEHTFSIVEDTGNICPMLTPRVESALLVRVDNGGTESMQQHGLDVFLMGVIGTARDHLPVDIAIDRNAAEVSMTKKSNRPDYLCSINGQLVFKGEEKRRGEVRTIAQELIDKMLPDVVGKGGKLAYLFGYATAGTRVLFECIHDDKQMYECSDILDLAKMHDRITMIIIIVNIIRISRAMLGK